MTNDFTVFVYGSLMWDGWAEGFNPSARRAARLNGYARAFNKPSIKRWGSPKHPAPTLNLEEGRGKHCDGVAFDFNSEDAESVTRYILKREGPGFSFHEISVELETGGTVIASTAIYNGDGLLPGTEAELIEMARLASGVAGTGVDYIVGVKKSLDKAGFKDAAVDLLIAEIKRLGINIGA